MVFQRRIIQTQCNSVPFSHGAATPPGELGGDQSGTPQGAAVLRCSGEGPGVSDGECWVMWPRVDQLTEHPSLVQHALRYS